MNEKKTEQTNKKREENVISVSNLYKPNICLLQYCL